MARLILRPTYLVPDRAVVVVVVVCSPRVNTTEPSVKEHHILPLRDK